MHTRLKSLGSRLHSRPLEDLGKLRIGVAALVVLVVVVGVTVYLNSLHLGERTYRADFAQAAGIGAGDQVTDAGIPVGTVTSTRLEHDHVVVTMKIKGDVVLGADTKAAIKLTTLLGSRYVELRPAGSGGIPDQTIALSNTEVPYDLETALQNATTTFSQVDADQIGQMMTTVSRQLQGTPALVPEVLRNINTLATVLAQRRAQIGSLLTSTSQVTTVINSQQANLGAMVDQGRQVLVQIIARQKTIEGIVDAATTLVQQLEPILVNDRPEIQQLLGNLSTMTKMIAGHDDLLRNLLQILPVPWRLFANATGTADELVGNAPDGAFIDSFMCALSERAEQVHLPRYLKDCK